MKIAVVGPGALGCLFAAKLGKKNEVWLIDHEPDRAMIIQKQGLILDEGGSTETVQVNVTSEISKISEVELVLICVKSASVKDVVLSLIPSIRNGHPLFVALQNGIGHLEVLSGLMTGTWALGVTSQGATLSGSGSVMHRGEGPTRIGFPGGQKGSQNKDRLTSVASVLTKSGIPTETSDDIDLHVWNKLMINVGINALTAIHNCPNGKLIDSKETLLTMEKAVLEAESVAKKAGIRIGPDPVARTIEVCRATSGNISSMLQDVRKKRKTEIDAINGALVRKGHDFGVEVPVNEELVRKVKEIEKDFH